jgi:hypothetical protein
MADTKAKTDTKAKISILGTLGLLIAGIGAGAGAGIGGALGWDAWQAAQAAAPEPDLPPEYVKLGPALIPLADPEGRLAGYARIDIALEVKGGEALKLQDLVPVVRHEINMTAWREPLAAGPDNRFVALERVRTMVAAATERALGPGVAKRVLVQAVTPA